MSIVYTRASGTGRAIEFHRYDRIYLDTSGSMVCVPGFNDLFTYLTKPNFSGRVFQVGTEVKPLRLGDLPFNGGTMLNVLRKHWFDWAATQSPEVKTLLITDDLTETGPGATLGDRLFRDRVFRVHVTEAVQSVPTSALTPPAANQYEVTEATAHLKRAAKMFSAELASWAKIVDFVYGTGDNRPERARQLQLVLNDIAERL